METCTCTSAKREGAAHASGSGALDTVQKLLPSAVVAGHKRDGDTDSPENIARTRRYIEDFTTAAEKARSHTDLYGAMAALYPNA